MKRHFRELEVGEEFWFPGRPASIAEKTGEDTFRWDVGTEGNANPHTEIHSMWEEKEAPEEVYVSFKRRVVNGLMRGFLHPAVIHAMEETLSYRQRRRLWEELGFAGSWEAIAECVERRRDKELDIA